MTDIREQIARLSPEQRKLFLQRLQREPQPALVPHIPRRADPAQAPLSFAQQRMWLLDQLEPGNPLYTMTPTMRLTGPLDVAALERSLNAIIQRQETLRATFPAVDGQPQQVIAPRLTIALPLTDLRDHAPAARETMAQDLINAASGYRFDLATGPLVCARLLRLADDDHILTVMMHHIVTDGWSLGVLIRELMALYVAQTTHRPTMLAALPIQYADFAAWQRARLQGVFLETQLGYWRQHLADVPVLQLPTDYARPAIQTYRSATLPLALTPTLVGGLKALSRRTGTTLFMTQLAAFAALLGRLSGQSDFCVGSLVANRTQPELEGLIGFFINTLALRVDLRDQPSAEMLLRRVRVVTLGAYDHQDVPFELVLAGLPPTRNASHTPLFQVMCVMQNFPRPRQVLPGLVLHPLYTASRRSGFDLTFWCWEEAGSLAGELEYNPTLFTPATIQRIAGQLRTLLTHIVATPDRPISELLLLSAAEQHQLLVEWNATAALYPQNCCVHQLFEAQAAQTPDAVAVVFEAARLTYRELNARANQLAHYLRALGVGPETLVGLSLARSLDLIIGVLGVLKTGGAYLPLDPTYPDERLAFMLADSQAGVLLTTKDEGRRTKGDLEEAQSSIVNRKSKIVNLDADGPAIARQPTTPPSSSVTPDQLAYVIYTSGSTGQAKGVLIPHRNLVNAYHSWADAYALRTAVRVHLQLASFSFDVFSGDLVRALGSGGTLVLCPRETLLEPPRLAGLLRQERVDTAEFVPVVLRKLMQHLAQRGQRLDGLRLLVCGSDSWYLGEYQQFQRGCGAQTRLINSFGLTEATIDSLYLADAPKDGSADQLVPIGRPFANTRIYILDAQLQPVPIGVAGELYIGGAGLARGYLRRPDVTAERFVPNPFAGDKETREAVEPQSAICNLQSAIGTRLYKTGDRARYHADGLIEFLGRADQQIKIRGFRIELGEIEAVLQRHPAIYASAVVARPAPSDELRLVAYVVPSKDDCTDTIYRVPTTDDDDLANSSIVHRPSSIVSDLRSFLSARLPEYMIPSAFVFLATLPLTPTGKVDRPALPPPDWSRRTLSDSYIAPRTPVEEEIAGIWAEVLGVAQVGVADNFFALGGHSLLATQVISRMREAFQIELPLRALFEAPTVAGLAAQHTHQRSAHTRLLPPILPVAHAGPLPLAFAQQRLWFLDQLTPGSATYNIPTPVRLTGALDLAALQASFDALVRRHETLRTTFALRDEQPIQLIAAPTPLPLAVVDVQALPADVRAALAERLTSAEAQQPFDLARSPLIRATLVRIAAREHLILLTLHHIIADGWSVGVLIRDLAALYTAAISRRPALLPALPIQYADYAIWQQQWLQGADDHAGSPLQAQLAYWTRQLADAPPTLNLPLDRPRPPIQTAHGAQQPLVVPPPLLAALQTLSRREGATLFMTLLAVFQVVLARHSGHDDIVVGSPIAGRMQRATEGLIGFFVNTLVLRTDLAGNPSFRTLLGRVREVCLSAYAHQDLPFEQLVDAVQPLRDLRHHPLFQIMFVLQNAPVSALDVPGLTLRPVPIDTQTAKFDMSLSINESAAGLVAAWEYNTDLFDAATISRMCNHFRQLLTSIVANPALCLADLPLLTAQEQQQLREWNATGTTYPRDASIHALFAAQAARTPDALAVLVDDPAAAAMAGQQHLSYRELNRRANQLAQHLQRCGVGPEVRVGLQLARSLDLIVALLAVLKAGGAYLPLDPTYPAARLALMRADADVRVLITQQSIYDLRLTIDDLGAPDTPIINRKSKIVNLAVDWPQIARMPDHDPAAVVRADQLAYVMYTSGSTGTPKGVSVSHRSVVRLVCTTNYAQFDANQVCLHLAPIAFDAATFEIWGALLHGSQLVVFPAPALALDDLARTLQRTRVSTLWLTAGLFQQLVEQRLDALRHVRQLLAGGDVLSSAHVQRVLRALPDCRVINGYGPTENTTFTCCYPMHDAALVGLAVPIGRPIANTQVYVLDRALQPVPIGVTGELYIGGDGLARGYLNRPDLTAERFVPNPFASANAVGAQYIVPLQTQNFASLPLDHSSRLYRTGDLVCYRADGSIAFLGRSDTQVKLRGFRIELGEIEATLAQHPCVQACVIVARADTPDEKRLVAYVVQGPGDRAQGSGSEDKETRRRGDKETEAPVELLTPDPRSLIPNLRSFLSEKLPDYMLPTFVFLDALPLTPNGKLDRAALPAPDQAGSTRENTYVAPRDLVELQLVRIWQDLLGIQPIGVRDNFFELGGHSLLVVRLIARIQQQLGQRIPLAALFQDATIEYLATLVHQQPSAGQRSPLVALQAGGAKPPFFCVHPGAGTVLCYLDLAQRLGTAQPFYGLQAAGLEDDQPPRTRIEDMAAAYIAAIRTVQLHGPYQLGGWSFGGLVAFEMAQQLHAQGQEIALLALIDSAPLPPDTVLPSDEITLLAWFAHDLGRTVGKTAPITIDELRRIAPEQRLRYVLDQASAADVLPPDIDEQQIRRGLAVFANNLQAMQRYQPQPYAGRVTLFRADVQATEDVADPTLGWDAFATDGVALHAIPGDHYMIVRPPQVQLLAEQLHACLEAAPIDASTDLALEYSLCAEL